MSRRRAQLVLVCEDRQHEAFIRRFLESSGSSTRRLRVEMNPKGRGSGEQWVRKTYATEVKRLRAKPHLFAQGLIVAIDQDRPENDREAQLQEELRINNLSERMGGESIAHVIPARNIETWLAYLAGSDVNETIAYPKLTKESDCAAMVIELKRMCDARELRQPAPSSLERTCTDYRTRLPRA